MIEISLKEILKEKAITSKELAAMIDITEANLSILCSGKAKAIRFSTLDKICEILDVSPGDIIKYNKE